MYSVRGQISVKSSVLELPAQESRGELLWSREVFIWSILSLWLVTIAHAWSLIERITNLQWGVWVPHLVRFRGECSWDDILLFDCTHVCLNLSIYHYIEFSVLSHLFQYLMLICLLRVLECQVALALFQINNKNHKHHHENKKLNWKIIRSAVTSWIHSSHLIWKTVFCHI